MGAGRLMPLATGMLVVLGSVGVAGALAPAAVAQDRDARFFTVGVNAWGRALDGRYELQIGDTAWTIRRGGFQLVESERPQRVVLWRTSDCRVLARFTAGPETGPARNTIVIGDATGHINWSHGGSDAVDTTSLDDHSHAPSCSLPDTSTSDTPDPSASPSPSASPIAVTTTSRFTTCGGHAYPGLGIDAPAGYGSIDEIQALEPALLRYSAEFPGASDWPWRLAGRDDTGMLFLAETDALGPPSWVYVEVQGVGDDRSDTIGQCDPRIVTSPDLGPADWWLDPDAIPPGSGSTELHLLVLEQACAGGASAEGRIAEPVVDSRPTTVTITIGVHQKEGMQACPMGRPTPFVVRLAEPLGDRTLLDGGHARPIVPTAPQ